MTYTSPSAQDFRKMSAPEIEAAARRERAAFVAGLLSAACRVVTSLVGRIGASTPANELHALDDRTLADIGIARHDIARVVKHGRDDGWQVRIAHPAANVDVKPQAANTATAERAA